MKIKEYTKATSLANTDALIIETTNGTRYIEAQNLGFLKSIGTVAVANGGTGATTVAAARNNLGLGNTSGALPIANGGTGQTSVAAARNALGLGNTTGALPVANGGTGVTTEAAIGLKAYPVGSIFIAYNSTSPASRFGGTWTQITGRFLRAANDVSTGGSDSITLTSAQMPSHKHNMGIRPSGTEQKGYGLSTSGGFTDRAMTNPNGSTTGNWDTATTGSGSSFNNMPAYQDIYVWRRTA